MLFILLFGLLFAQETNKCTDKNINEDCSSCLDGISEVEDKHCVAPQTIVDGCLDINYDKKCIKCVDGRQLKQGKCVEGEMAGCIQYNGENGQCVKCSNGYMLISGKCQRCKFNSHECELGKYNENGTCYGKIVTVGEDKLCVEGPVKFDICDYRIDTYVGDSITHVCKKCSEGYALNAEETKCTECATGYFKVSDECKPNNITHCETQTSGTECTKCEKYYYLNETAKTQDPANQCKLKIEYCTEFESNNNGECKTCEGKRYVSVDKKSCLDYNITHCAEQTSEKVCKTCEDYYNITQAKDACNEFEIQNCIRVDSTDVKLCGACKANYYVSVDKKSCLDYNITNCLTQTSEKVCTKCKDYYNLTEAKDACNRIEIQNCIRVDTTDVKLCSACETDYILSEDKKSCVAKISNCETQKGENCTKCETKYALTAQGTCKKCPEHCNKCDPTGTICYECEAVSGSAVYVLDNKDCKLVNLTQTHDDAFVCNGKNINSDCSGCIDSGLILNRTNQCVAPQSYVEGCEDLDDLETCSSCTKGYVFNEHTKKCDSIVDENCLQYGDKVCSECKMGFGYDSEEKKCKQCSDKSNKCTFENGFEKRQECYGIYVNGTTCENKYSMEGCTYQYSVRIGDSVDTKCDTTCDSGYVNMFFGSIDGDTSKCYKQIPNCQSYKNPKVCTKCFNYYNLTEAKDACNRIEIDHCIRVDTTDVKLCAECETKYYLSKDKKSCLANNITNCETQTSEKVCTKCEKYYYLNETAKTQDPAKQCQLKIEYCTEFESNNNGECKTCEGKHYVSKDKKSCLDYNITHCAEQTSEKVCKTCEQYYYLNETAKTQDPANQCQLRIEYCISFLNSNGNCETCEGKHYVSVDKKSCLDYNITNCEKQTSEKVCQTCKDYYNLTEAKDACNRIEIQNCIRVDTTDVKLCSACETNYYLSEDKKSCPAKMDNCKTQSKKDRCDVCNIQYGLKADGTCVQCPEHCNHCDALGEICYQCENNYQLVNEKCKKIESIVKPNQTKYEPPKCKECEKCKECKECEECPDDKDDNDDKNEGSNSGVKEISIIALTFIIFVFLF